MTTLADALTTAQQYHQAGDLAQAEAMYRQILAADPSHPTALHFLGVIAHQVGQHHVAVDYMKQSIAREPSNEGFRCNLGLAYQALGSLEEAATCYRDALRLRHDCAEAHNGLGIALADMGRLEEAVASYQQALRHDPKSAAAHNNLAVALQAQGKPAEAETHLRKAVRLQPDYIEARNNLGIAQRAQGKLQEALINFQAVLRIQPGHALAHNNLGATLLMQGNLDGAMASFENALRSWPDYAEAHGNLGIALKMRGNLDEAEAHLREALRLRPASADVRNTLGGLLQLQGKLDEAMACFREAHRLAPGDPELHSNLLLCMNYDPKVDADSVFAEHRCWGHAFGRVPGAGPRKAHDRSPLRRLRIGYVSPDLCRHPLVRYLEPVLAHHDPAQVEIFCYAEVSAPDTVTARLQTLAQAWRWTCGKTDAQVAEQIRRDGIDILVDLASHTANNRLRVFAERPAPVQVTWLGYPNTTGLSTIDYRLTDDVMDPPGSPVLDTEELFRLPGGLCCFAPPADAPPVAPLPALRRGYLTFGSLHNLAKLNAGVLDLWCRVLQAVPEARLLLFRTTLTGTARDHVHRQFTERGLASERLDLRQGSAAPGYLGIYEEIDVALDTFPYAGGTTTCESLWMGAPMLSLGGTRPAARGSAALLAIVGLSDWVVPTSEEYVATAVRWANDLERLAQLRAGLRERTAATLCDARRFTRGLEEAYRTMWRRWCAQG
jgi:predicted O-linked N-acetylglucosamine transferase (SPINDLY family)